jgi:hypothetical protein
LKAEDLEQAGARIQDYMRAGAGAVGPVAIVVGSPEHHVQAEFFADASSPDRPLRIFHDVASARAWIEASADQAIPASRPRI